MNTLQDLRSTLDLHADDVHDDPSVARVAAVQGRARRARQQRAGAVALAAVLAVLGVVVVPSLAGRTPVRDERWLAGHEAPRAMTSLEYTYGFAEGVEAASIELRPSEEPRLLSWAADSDRAVLRDPNGEAQRTTATDFDDFVYVAPGMAGRWRLDAGASGSAFAVYELSEGIIPGGTEVGGLFFRNEVGDDLLIDAAATPDGESELRFTFPAPERRLRLADFCSGVPRDLWVNLSVNGDGATASGGCDDDRFDPGASGSWYPTRQLGVELGEPVEARMWVSREVDGPAVAVPGVELALGAYDVPPPADEVAGWDVPQEYEYEGHTWRYVDSVELTPGQGSLTPQGEVDGSTLALVSFRVGGSARVRVSAGDQVSIGQMSSQEAFVLDRVNELRVRVTRGLTPDTWLGAAFYRRVD